MQHPSKGEQREASSSVGATHGKSLLSSYLPIDKDTYYYLCGSCCDCGKIGDRTVEKALSSEGQTTKGDGDGKDGGSIEGLTRYRPQQLEIHAYEPSIINYRWLAHFYNPTTTRRSTVSESPPSSSHYLGLGGNRLNISIYNMGVGKTSRSDAAKGGDISSDRSTSDDTVAYFPILSLGNERGAIHFTPGLKHRAVSLTSLDEHLLPILRQREEGIRDDKLTRAFLSSSKMNISDGKSEYETIRPRTSDPLYFPIDVLYTDTEGFDEHVAQGADFLLSNNMVAVYQFEMQFVINYTSVFDKLSSYDYVCYFETESVEGKEVPKLIRITHGCWRKEYESLSGWMNALCYHMTLFKHSDLHTSDMEGNERDGATKEMSSRIDWDSLLSKEDPNHLTIDTNNEVSRKWAGSLMLQPLRGIFASLEQSYHRTRYPGCTGSAKKQRRVVRALIARHGDGMKP